MVGSGGVDSKLLSALEEGKYTMIPFEDVGHVIHEDKPAKVAESIHYFLENQRIAADCNQ